MKSEPDKIGGYYNQIKGENAVYIFPDPIDLVNHPEVDYGELHEATCRWFVDQRGFSTRSFTVCDATKKYADAVVNGPVVQVTFVDDGIVMAKIQGIIE